jgi:pyridoxine 5-phosphate synthase
MLHLGVNVDHVATVRQARYRGVTHGLTPEPSPVDFARECGAAGAHSITAHVREDRRHMQDADVFELRARSGLPLNLEMANTPAMVRLALKLFSGPVWAKRGRYVCVVPEKREELSTEGGLDVISAVRPLAANALTLQKRGVIVSLFVDPDPDQVRAAADTGADFVELHTGTYANARHGRTALAELRRLSAAAALANELGLGVNAGHGLHYDNLAPFLKAVPHLHELNIGHAIVSRALTTGARRAVKDMLTLMKAYRR